MCISLIALLLENAELLYILLFFCLHIEILAVSSLFKCLIAIKYSKSRVETHQIFIVIWVVGFKANCSLVVFGSTRETPSVGGLSKGS